MTVTDPNGQIEGCEKAMALALKFLSNRNRTVHEVRRKLEDVGTPPDAMDYTIERLTEIGYLDDTAFATQFADSRLRSKLHGPQRIRVDLRRLGVRDSVIDDCMTAVTDNDEDVREAAGRAGRRYWHRVSTESDLRRRRGRFVQYLVRRGFDFDTARAVYESVLAEYGSDH